MQNKELNIVIIGSSGAIGSAFTQYYSQIENVKNIYAFSRKINNFNHPKIIENNIDIEDENSIANAAKIASENGKIDYVIVATGMLHDNEIFPEKSLKELDKNKLQKLFNINTIAPAIMCKYFIPLLSIDRNSIFAALSARVGSISDNNIGGWYSYRASKAALNMIIKTASIEGKRINKNAIIIGLHPGTVNSKLSEPFQNYVKNDKLFSPQYSISKLANVIDNLAVADTGKIIDFNGLKIEY